MRSRTIRFSSVSNASWARVRNSAYVSDSESPAYCASTSSSTFFVASWRSSLSSTDVAASSAAPCESTIWRTRSSSTGGAVISSLGLPAFSASSRWAATSFLISPWAMSSASRISASGISFAPASTIRIASSVPATTRSRSDSSSASSLGLTTKLPSTLPIRTAPTGVGNGTLETISAADAPFMASTSYGVRVVDRQRDRHELRLVAPALREERAQGAVDHARDQRRLLAGAALALEERARDLARGVHPLLDVDGEREEVDLAQIARGGRVEDERVARSDEHRAGGLLGQASRLERDLGPADFDGDPVNFCHVFLSLPAARSVAGAYCTRIVSVDSPHMLAAQGRSAACPRARRGTVSPRARTDRPVRRHRLHRAPDCRAPARPRRAAASRRPLGRAAGLAGGRARRSGVAARRRVPAQFGLRSRG